MQKNPIRRTRIRWLVAVAGLFGGFHFVVAQESAALVSALIRKGVLTNQEAEDIRAELMAENNGTPARVVAGGKHTHLLTMGMRMQMQYANLDTDVQGAEFAPTSTNHAFLRRMYLTLKSGLGAGWGAQFTYDFSGGSYDDAFLYWKSNEDLTFNFGLRKVNVAYEERRSSGDLRAIERSGVTRYFVEANNGRRLGAASYRVGAFLDGKRDLPGDLRLVYGAAVTTPERNETFELASSPGTGASNQPAYWGNVALTGKFAPQNASWLVGTGVGYLPDQGGFGTANLGRGHDLTLYSVHADLVFGPFNFLTEYLAADVERGRADAHDAVPRGFFIQPSAYLSDSLEVVVRFQSLDSDGRGLTLADVVRSSPSGGTMNTFKEWYAGLNWYLHGDDLKVQFGALYGETKDTVAGAPARAKTVGARSQIQMQF